MLGAIFGDIAGSVYEFHNIKTTQFELFSRATTYTDDSILTIAVADWLMSGVLSKERLVSVIKSYVAKYPHPMGSYGSNFYNWATSEDSQPYNSWGNGSAMRVSAVGWAFKTLEETEQIAALTAEITHNHPEGIKGACAAAAAIFLARNKATKQEIKTYIEKKYHYNLNRTCDQIRPQYTYNESSSETVPQAIIAFMDSNDFESAIRIAISLGGDSDTLACITGGIAEAFYGMEHSIPTSTDSLYEPIWFAKIALNKLPEDLSIVVDSFYKTVVKSGKLFRAKNESSTISGTVKWTNIKLEDKTLDEESYESFLKGYNPDWEMRFGVYYEDGWNYVYRSNFLLRKFRFEKRSDGLYHLTDTFTSNNNNSELIEEVLRNGYFKPPYRYLPFSGSN